MIGISFLHEAFGVSLIILVTVKPSIPGICKSSMTKSNVFRANKAMALAPSVDVTTQCPRLVNIFSKI